MSVRSHVEPNGAAIGSTPQLMRPRHIPGPRREDAAQRVLMRFRWSALTFVVCWPVPQGPTLRFDARRADRS